MLNTLKFEINRAVKSKAFLCSIIISCTIVIMDLICFNNYLDRWGDERYPSPLIEVWIGTDYKFAFNALFYIVLPILAALPYAGSYYEDLQSGYMKNICIKASRKSYYIAKYVSAFLSGFVAVCIPLIISMMLCMLYYPLFQPEKLRFLCVSIQDVNFMSEICNSNPTLYILIYIVIDSFFAGIIAVFSVCIAEHMQSKFTAIVAPFAVYVLSGIAFAKVRYNWSILYMLNPIQPYGNQGWIIAITAILGITITITWIWLKGRRKDVL